MKKSIKIFVADDDADDRYLLEQAWKENRIQNELVFFEDGEALMNQLQDPKLGLPNLILLDLNMPKLDGRECIALIKANPLLKKIPLIVLTTSKTEEDILKSYQLGVNSFISKPVSFESLVEIVKQMDRYWFDIVELPEVQLVQECFTANQEL